MNNINTYRLELDNCKHPVLILEESMTCDIISIEHPQNAVNILNTIFHLNRLAEEHVIMIAADTKGNVLGIFNVSHGTVNLSICNPREIYIRALMVGAANIFIVHNHPSGNCNPSDDDVKIARQISDVGNILGIIMLDFIIVGNGTYYSFKEHKTL